MPDEFAPPQHKPELPACPTTTDDLLTVKDVAARLKISGSCVNALATAGRLPGYKVGLGRGTWRFAEADLAAYLESCKTPTASPSTRKRSKPPQPFKHLDGERLHAAWRRQGVSAGQQGGRNARSSD